MRDGSVEIVATWAQMELSAPAGLLLLFFDPRKRAVGLAAAGFAKSGDIRVGYWDPGASSFRTTVTRAKHGWDECDALAFDPLRGRLVHLSRSNAGLDACELADDGQWKAGQRRLVGRRPAAEKHRLRAAWDECGKRVVVIVTSKASTRTYAWDGKAMMSLHEVPQKADTVAEWSSYAFMRMPVSHELAYCTKERDEVVVYALEGDSWERVGGFELDEFSCGTHDPASDRALLFGPLKKGRGLLLRGALDLHRGEEIGVELSFPIVERNLVSSTPGLATSDGILTFLDQGYGRQSLHRIHSDTIYEAEHPHERMLGLAMYGGAPCVVTEGGAVHRVGHASTTRVVVPEPQLMGRSGSLVVSDRAGGRLFLLGGFHRQSDKNVRDTWVCESASWRRLAGRSPEAVSAAGAFDEKNEQLIVWGGVAEEDKKTWELDGDEWTPYVTMIGGAPVDFSGCLRSRPGTTRALRSSLFASPTASPRCSSTAARGFGPPSPISSATPRRAAPTILGRVSSGRWAAALRECGERDVGGAQDRRAVAR